MNTYTLTPAEVALYDSADDVQCEQLRGSLRQRFGQVAAGAPVTTEVVHPDGFVVEQYTAAAD